MAGCDTLVILPSGSMSSNSIFAKNRSVIFFVALHVSSDREMNEAQSLTFVRGSKGGKVKCTYMEIDMNDDSTDTFDCFFQNLSAEMGVNQMGFFPVNAVCARVGEFNIAPDCINSSTTFFALLKHAISNGCPTNYGYS